MINIKALRDQRAEKAREARNLLDTNTGAKWSKDVEAQVDAIYEEIDRIDGQIARAERQAQIDGDEATGTSDSQREREARRIHGLTPEQREQDGAYNAAFNNWVIRGERGITAEEMTVLRAGRPQAAQSGQPGNGTQGGYLVPTGFGGELLEALKSFGGMRQVGTTIQTSSGIAIPWPTVDETSQTGEIVAENSPASSEDATFGTVSIGAYKWSSKIFTVPFELLQDQGPGIDIEGFIRSAAATRIGRAQNAKYTVGTGTNEPTGLIVSAPVGVAAATGSVSAVTSDNLIDLEHSVDPAYRAKQGVGYMWHDTTLREVKKLKDSENRPLWLPGFALKEPDTFNGYRYTINQDMPQMEASAKSIAFGDFSEFLIRDVMAVTLFRFDDSAYIKNGQIGFLAWARGDGKLITAGAPVKTFQQSAT